jgi:outer membrane protein insertion porin family
MCIMQVRGYAEGGLGTGRQWAEGTAELRFPLVAPLSAQLFADAGTDFDSGSTVIGDPAGENFVTFRNQNTYGWGL